MGRASAKRDGRQPITPRPHSAGRGKADCRSFDEARICHCLPQPCILGAVAKRVCYIHIGPHKTGTSEIQWFLKENRAELLKHGYFVPESGTARGAHHPLARDFCGEPVPERKKFAAAKFAHQLGKTRAGAVIISSEALAGLFRQPEYAQRFFARIVELNLQPKLLVFPRNQPQWINSRYADGV